MTGSAIVLVQNGAVVEGHVGNAAGALAFTVTVDASGNVTLDQIRAVVHNISSNPDTSEGVTLSADNLVTLTATVTDKDGDHQSATANIGQNLVFNDDGPTAINDSDTIASGGNSATGNVITGIGTDGGVATADNAGADQPGHITAIQGTDGTDTTFAAGVLSIHGSFGTLAIDADGNYTYTRDARRAGKRRRRVHLHAARRGRRHDDGHADHPHQRRRAESRRRRFGAARRRRAGRRQCRWPGDRTPDMQSTPRHACSRPAATATSITSSPPQTLPTGFTSVLRLWPGCRHLQISQNGTLVITVTLNNETGDYTVVQNAPIMHALDGNTEGEVPLGNILSAINVNFFAQDADGDQSAPTIIASASTTIRRRSSHRRHPADADGRRDQPCDQRHGELFRRVHRLVRRRRARRPPARSLMRSASARRARTAASSMSLPARPSCSCSTAMSLKAMSATRPARSPSPSASMLPAM